MEMKKFSGNWFILDIETTGFYAESSYLVAIGLKNIKEEKMFFVEKPSEEGKVIQEFLELLKERNIEVLAGYNLISFDLPYLKGKCLLNNLSFEILEEVKVIDLLEIAKKFKFRNYTLSYLSNLLFSNFNTNSMQIPNFYSKYLAGQEEVKEKILFHLKKDLENSLLLCKKFKVI